MFKKIASIFADPAAPLDAEAVVAPVAEPTPQPAIDAKADKILVHTFDADSPTLPKLTTRLATAQAGSLATAERLIGAYHLSIESINSANYTRKENDLWSDIVEKELAELIVILNNKDAVKLVDYLMHFGESYTWFGGLCFSLDGYNHLNKAEKNVAISYFDKLICLAVAVGAISHENPEQGAWGEHVKLDADTLTQLISRETGTSLQVPQGIVPVTGIDTDLGPIHYRHLNAYYAAWRVKNLAAKSDGSYASVCEFGAGNGIAAYYASRMGVDRYTTLDLPITNVFSGWFLINALGGDKVSLHGETPKDTGVTILPSWKCADIPANAFDVVLNQDSFPEIDRTLLLSYFDVILKTSKAYFLSINHETESPMADVKHSHVSKLLRRHPHFHLLARSKYWVREGYVEELYKVSK
jgi:hypothetical protein